MLQLRQERERIESLNMAVLIITFESKAVAELYARDAKPGWPLLFDTDRELYHAYDMGRGGAWQVFGIHSWWTYIKLLFKGRKIKRPTDDVRQLGGDVLIDPNGIVRLHHVGERPADRPSVASLLEVVEGK